MSGPHRAEGAQERKKRTLSIGNGITGRLKKRTAGARSKRNPNGPNHFAFIASQRFGQETVKPSSSFNAAACGWDLVCWSEVRASLKTAFSLVPARHRCGAVGA